MSEYILFDEGLRDQFVRFVTCHGLKCDVRPDRIAGYVIHVPDDLSEDTEDALEDEYEALMTLQQEMVESAEESIERTVMAVGVLLTDGRELSICLPAAYARRLHEHFTIDEIRDLVTTIAQGAVDPQAGPLCCRVSE